jgi:pentatricopeptide repeat protein
VRKDRAIYNALINSLQIAGKWNLAVDVLEKGSEDEILPSQQVEYLSAEEAFRRARDVYSKGVEEGALSEWYRDENDNLVLDLHHFPLSVAVTAVSLVFQKMRTSDISPARLRIITGRGNHINSSGSRGLLRAEIESFVLNEICPEGLLMIERVPGNDGCVDVKKESIAEWIASSSIKEDSHM